MRLNIFARRPARVPNLAIGMTVKFNGVRYTISSDVQYYDNDVNLLLVPKRAEDEPLSS